MAKLLSESLIAALRAAGLADDDTRRVVIDITANERPIVYVERYGDDRIIQVVEALTSADVKIIKAEE